MDTEREPMDIQAVVERLEEELYWEGWSADGAWRYCDNLLHTRGTQEERESAVLFALRDLGLLHLVETPVLEVAA